ncbi:hypothetical protein SDC9_140238 [bioreactor metagenome]|uniref:Uncharacterized protein n=1 Tax=bioreactor metagenome TaxID=1076179 RepID=A0A645DXP6_9ZZZZ
MCGDIDQADIIIISVPETVVHQALECVSIMRLIEADAYALISPLVLSECLGHVDDIVARGRLGIRVSDKAV